MSAPTAGTALTDYTLLSKSIPVNAQVDGLTSSQTIQVVEANALTLQPISYGTATIVTK